MDLIQLAVPFFLLAIALEIVWGFWRGANTYRLNDTFGSLMLGNLSQARKFVTLGIGGWVYHHITESFSLPLLAAESWWTWVLAFVLYDFCYYWLHRMGHERQILWAAHVAHHQSEEYNLSTALRQTSTGFLLGWVFYIPMFVLGVPADVVVTVGALNLIYQFWVHTRHVPELGVLEYVFVTPSNHRVHHAQNDCYLDRNYGGVFILWDRLFGTYQRELPEEPCIYGIRGPIRSWNPLVALTHIYADMIDDMRRTKSWHDRFRVLTARTGWQPDDVARSHPRGKSDLSRFEKYDPVVANPVRWYGGLQLLVATFLLACGELAGIDAGAQLLVWALMLWTGVVGAWWLGGRSGEALVLFDAARLAGLLALVLAGLSDGWYWAGLALIMLSAVALGVLGRQEKTRQAEALAGSR